MIVMHICVELKNPRENQADGGIFAASKRSQVANPTVSTSYFMEETDDVFNERRRYVILNYSVG